MDTDVDIRIWWEDAEGVRHALENNGMKLNRDITEPDLERIQAFMQGATSVIFDQMNDLFEEAVLDVFEDELEEVEAVEEEE